MSVVTQQQVEANNNSNNNNESSRSRSRSSSGSGFGSSIDEVAGVYASETESLKLEMIRMYEGGFEDDDDNDDDDSYGSTLSDSTEVGTELMIGRIYKETICPMICADIKRKHQNFLFMVHEKFGLNLSMWNVYNMESNLAPQSLQLMFLNGICTPVVTGKIIEGNEHKPFVIALVDEMSGQIVTTGAEAAMEVEIVVLEGDSNDDDDEADNCTSDKFNKMIVSEWKGKKVIQGNTFVKLNEGVGYVDKISLTHNAEWKGQKKCRIGARSVNAVFPTYIKEAKTKSFLVLDKRNLLYCKHKIPSLSDPLYRLSEISRRGKCFERLREAHIKTVMDLLTIHAINPQRLEDILDVRPNTRKIIMNHANKCKDDKGKYLYHYPTDGQKSNGVAFNASGQLVGITADFRFVQCNMLPSDERADAQKLIMSSSEHWKEVVSFSDQDSLIKHVHQSHTTLNPLSDNTLNVVIPQTTDPHNHTNLTSPQSKSQSPKRLASEHATSNSPKQPRYDHPKLSPSTSGGVGMDTNMPHKQNSLDSKPNDDDDDISMYLDMFDKWKIVCFAVEWLSMISKVRKRRTKTFFHDNTVIVIAASVENAQTCD